MGVVNCSVGKGETGRFRRGRVVVLGISLACSIASATARAQTVIELRSGQGPVGGTDAAITMLLGPVEAPFPASFSASDFAAADAGPSAFIIQPHSLWPVALPSDPAAKWLSSVTSTTIEARSTLFAVSFDAGVGCIGGAVLDIQFAVDDSLGWGAEQGLYLNGQPIPGTHLAPGVNTVVTLTGLDVSNAIVSGHNVLYVYAVNTLDPGGVIFNATLTIEHPGCWTNLQSALAGTSGEPSLVGTGSMLPGTPITLSLTNGPTFAPTVLVTGLTAISAPFKGGVLVPHPGLLVFSATDGFGSLTFGAPWPAGVPSGLDLYMQFWVTDAGGPQGFAASNAVKATTP